MNVKKFLIDNQMILFKVVTLIGMIIFFIVSGWKGIIGFFLGTFFISYLLLTDNRQFSSIIMVSKLKMNKERKDEIF